MQRKKQILALVAVLMSAGAWAESAGQLPPISDKEPIYGSHMMTQQERSEFHQRLRNSNTLEERERIRAEHHERMKIRAQERGLSIPDSPPGQGGGGMMGPGGGGVGPGGGGMGPGGGGKGGGGR